MRSGSRTALERARDRWEGLLANRPGEELHLGIQIFSVVDILKSLTRLPTRWKMNRGSMMNVHG